MMFAAGKGLSRTAHGVYALGHGFGKDSCGPAMAVEDPGEDSIRFAICSGWFAQIESRHIAALRKDDFKASPRRFP